MLDIQNNTISLEDVTLTYPDGTTVLRNASAVIPPSSITYILGASGSGKSTLMQSMIGLLPPARGTIHIEYNDIYDIPSSLLYSLIGVVFQSGALLEDRTIEDNLKLILQHNTTFSDEMMQSAIDSALASVHLLDAKRKFPSELSGGMRKRAALARALVLDKTILICDEPTSGLDPIASMQIESLLFDIHATKKNMTLCIISHDIRSALANATHILLIHNATLHSFPNTQALLEVEDEYIKSFISAGIGE